MTEAVSIRESQRFYLREDLSDLYWSGDSWVSSFEKARGFAALESVFDEVRRLGCKSTSLLAVLETPPRTIIFPLDTWSASEQS